MARPSRERYSQRRRNNQDGRQRREQRRGIWMIGLSALVLVMIVGGSIFFQLSRAETDSETLCPISGPVSIVTVLLDVTDALSPVQRALVRTRLMDLRDGLPVAAKIEVYSLSSIKNELLLPEVALCNPGRGSDVSMWVANQKRVEKIWRERFSEWIEAALDHVVEADEADYSPILEAVQSIAATSFAGERRSSIPRRLVIISDLLEHTPHHSQYAGVQSFERFRETSYFRRIRPNLAGVDVNILYLRRETRRNIQGREHIGFWAEFFSDAGATLSHVVSI